ncbi:replication initiation factor domain-containing protein [Pseudoxanthomonas sp. CF125]|uniref:replication initiation factor domain-containing protein n=1 Tax=Pseudoxanthomonas sp. CF125 TaxID=1855303 RepID=UPI00087FFEDE|nr:replication initiation factor domain-containing protein [Pseudoxanthomonas sp. CF125]SDR10839.1 hypothetical protein SAMN05216569_3133 [Pseudoxanthomonas sp. CF125]
MNKISMVVDKLTTAYRYGPDVKADSEYQAVVSFGLSVKDHEFKPPGKTWKKAHRPYTIISQPLLGGSSLVTRYGYVLPRHYSWVTFNPSKVAADDWGYLNAYLGLMYDYGFQSLWQKAGLKQADIAIDVEGEQFSDYIFVDRRLRTGDASLESVGSTYLGFSNGQRMFNIYDKAKQLSDIHGITLPAPRLRIEARLRRPSILLNSLPHVHNPYSSLLALHRGDLAAPGSPILSSFRSRVESGEPADLVFHDRHKNEKEMLWSELKERVAPWWDPGKAWTNYPSSLGWLNKLGLHENALAIASLH